MQLASSRRWACLPRSRRQTGTSGRTRATTSGAWPQVLSCCVLYASRQTLLSRLLLSGAAFAGNFVPAPARPSRAAAVITIQRFLRGFLTRRRQASLTLPALLSSAAHHHPRRAEYQVYPCMLKRAEALAECRFRRMRDRTNLQRAASAKAAQEAAVAAARAANRAEFRRLHPSSAADFALLRGDVEAWFRQVLKPSHPAEPLHVLLGYRISSSGCPAGRHVHLHGRAVSEQLRRGAGAGARAQPQPGRGGPCEGPQAAAQQGAPAVGLLVGACRCDRASPPSSSSRSDLRLQAAERILHAVGHCSRSWHASQELVLLGEIEALRDAARPASQERIAQATLEAFANPVTLFLPRSRKSMVVYDPTSDRCCPALRTPWLRVCAGAAACAAGLLRPTPSRVSSCRPSPDLMRRTGQTSSWACGSCLQPMAPRTTNAVWRCCVPRWPCRCVLVPGSHTSARLL